MMTFRHCKPAGFLNGVFFGGKHFRGCRTQQLHQGPNFPPKQAVPWLFWERFQPKCFGGFGFQGGWKPVGILLLKVLS